jgi:hypothetical protein
MRTVVLSASLMILSFLGTASSDPQSMVINSVPSIDFNALASEPSCAAQSSAESSAVVQSIASGYCSQDCSPCFPVGSLCGGHRGKCESIPLC